MKPEELRAHLGGLIAGWEDECVEFKEANDNFPTSDIGKYFSALSNEANLRGRSAGWLIFGVRNSDHAVVGTSFREQRERLQSLKHQIAQGAGPSSTFREIHELVIDSGRVLLLEVPPAPRGIPISWNDHYYARHGESLAGLSLDKQDEIRRQGALDDWSAVLCENASLADLDPAAIAKARESFVTLHAGRLDPATVHSWDDAHFLDKAKITIRGRITRTALLLLGRDESTHLLNPFVAQLTWKLEGQEQDYAHFHPPFLLETSRLYQRIRNVRLRLERPGELIPIEFLKYDQRIVLEALHNGIAHQDYSRRERVLVIERPGELVFQSAGAFYDGIPDDYLLGNRTPTRYRNKFLVEAMFNLRMMDTMGYGIREVLFRGQMARYLPLPDYDVSDPARVVLSLPGRFIDENYSRALLTRTDIDLSEALALDAVQKRGTADAAAVTRLRRKGLIEGRQGRLHVAGSIAAATDTVDEYLHHRAFDDQYFCDLIVEFLRARGEGRRADFERLLQGKLSDLLSAQQKKNKIKNLLQKLRRAGVIASEGGTFGTIWRLAPP